MKRLFILSIFIISVGGVCFALEQTFTDLPASVEVLPAFSISLDKNQIDFGAVKPGTTKVLGEPGYFNEIRCRSNYGRSWYLKAEVISQPKLLGKELSLSSSVFKFRVIPSQAKSEPIKAKLEFESLETKPEIIYISQGDENLGKEVVLRFQYSFSPPPDAPAGVYSGQILFTLTDTP